METQTIEQIIIRDEEKAATAARWAKWAKDNPERVKATHERWLARNPGRTAEYQRLRILRLLDRIGVEAVRAIYRESANKWRTENPELYAEYQREYHRRRANDPVLRQQKREAALRFVHKNKTNPEWVAKRREMERASEKVRRQRKNKEKALAKQMAEQAEIWEQIPVPQQ